MFARSDAGQTEPSVWPRGITCLLNAMITSVSRVEAPDNLPLSSKTPIDASLQERSIERKPKSSWYPPKYSRSSLQAALV
jgi:hypothetical protein